MSAIDIADPFKVSSIMSLYPEVLFVCRIALETQNDPISCAPNFCERRGSYGRYHCSVRLVKTFVIKKQVCNSIGRNGHARRERSFCSNLDLTTNLTPVSTL